MVRMYAPYATPRRSVVHVCFISPSGGVVRMADPRFLHGLRMPRGLRPYALAAFGFALSACGVGNADAALEATAATSGDATAVAAPPSPPPAATARPAPASTPYPRRPATQ